MRSPSFAPPEVEDGMEPVVHEHALPAAHGAVVDPDHGGGGIGEAWIDIVPVELQDGVPVQGVDGGGMNRELHLPRGQGHVVYGE